MATATKVTVAELQEVLDKLSRGEVTLTEARKVYQAWLRS